MPQKHSKLYVLPFDHRGSFIKMFGYSESGLTSEAVELLSNYKHLVYEGFLHSLAMGVPKEASAILVDEQFGKRIHEEAKERGIIRILTVEKSGQDEFDFEYGDQFKVHINNFAPDYAKVLVRYNAQGDRSLNNRQIQKLQKINDFCKEANYGFLFELLAPPTKEELEEFGEEGYERDKRGAVMAESIRELQDGGIEPDVWKLEGLSSLNQMQDVVSEVRRDGRDAGVVVLGRGESEEKVKEWLRVAASIPGVIGFAVGRTVFKSELLAYHEKKKSFENAREGIAKNYKGFVDLFESARV